MCLHTHVPYVVVRVHEVLEKLIRSIGRFLVLEAQRPKYLQHMHVLKVIRLHCSKYIDRVQLTNLRPGTNTHSHFIIILPPPRHPRLCHGFSTRSTYRGAIRAVPSYSSTCTSHRRRGAPGTVLPCGGRVPRATDRATSLA